MNDNQILNFLQNGQDEKAFGKLYTVYPKFRSYVKSQGGQLDQTEDIFQDAIIVLYKKLEEKNFTSSNSIEAYLFTTAKYMYWQLSKGKKNVELDFDLAADFQSELDEAMERESKIQKAERALEVLGEKCKAILKAFYVEKKRMTEIAKLFSYSTEKSAKNQKYKCLESAKKKLIEL